MVDVTVKGLADKLKMPSSARLLEQFNKAGIPLTDENQIVTQEQQRLLLKYLQSAHGTKQSTSSGAEKVTLKRRIKNELPSDSKHKKVVVEVRKKRTYVKRDLDAEQKLAAEKQAQEDLAAEVAEASQEAVAEAEKQDETVAVLDEKTSAEDVQKTGEAVAEPKAATPEKVSRRAKKKLKLADKQSKAQARKLARGTVKGVKTTEASLQKHSFAKPTAPVVHEVTLPETLSVADLAKKMSVKAADVIKVMMGMGVMVTINQIIDRDTATLVVEEMGHKPVASADKDVEEMFAEEVQGTEIIPRSPVVTIMGHVDHGKTSLLDTIRRTKVASGEAGGITQHIGAYHVTTDRGGITFIDTPGHAAFTAMRARGAQLTDIVILIVAADDGVKPQTIEAIQHAKAADVPIIVAINKIDKPEADPEKVKNELTNYEVIPEDWGGDNMFVEISAKSGQGIDALLEAILLQAEVLELKAVQDVLARGLILESRLDKGRGPVASVLVKNGILHKGDILLAGLQYGRVKALLDDQGSEIKEAGPAMPVEVLGLSGVVNAGDEARVVVDERKAREVALFRQGKYRDVSLAGKQKASLEGLFKNLEDQAVSSLNIVLKADAQGSVEALTEALTKLSTDEVKVNVVAGNVGGITESDVNLAIASSAMIIGFNVRADSGAKALVEQNNVSLYYYSVIYDVVDEVKKALGGLLSPEMKERIVGVAQVREVFRSPKLGAIAGCMVVEGTVKRNNPIRVLRDNIVIYEGSLESLRRFKEDTVEVRQGMECGIGVKNYNDVKVDDLIEVYEVAAVERTL